MKVNKWTAGLAALGVVSLASIAQAEEKAANMVQTALSATTLSGYVDTSAQWNFGTGNNALPPYKFGGATKADGFNLDVVQIRIEKPLDEAEWAAGYRVDLWAGPDANVLNTQSILSSGKSDFALRQAYVALRMPVGNGIDWKVGVFDSIIGYESVEGPNNPNYTRSYGHSIEPQTHTGVLASYRFCDIFSASVGVANTTGPTINNRANDPVATAFNPDASAKAESYKSYMGSIAVTAPDTLGFLAGSTLYAGIVNGFDESYGDNSTSYYVGATVATPVQNLRVGVSFDDLDVHGPTGSFRGGETWSVAGYASFKATEKLSFHGRAEYLKDRGNQKFFTGGISDPSLAALSDETLALTATAQYDLWKNVISRLELRWDHSLNDENVFGGSGTSDGAPNAPSAGNAWMLALNVIYKF
ncbi:MAG: hypothetical protein C5B50_16120 [Verrucomicrobia bacterium]|nr:MAG: hypothetical protein C5B50_16120 [Verrucomicrobiota bacterium]